MNITDDVMCLQFVGMMLLAGMLSVPLIQN